MPIKEPTFKNLDEIFPWQKNIWNSLFQRKDLNRLPHALLFYGIEGVGKKQLAHAFANYLLCHLPKNNAACGECQACRLQMAKSHPDFICIEPEEGAQFIKIDQIRDVVNFVNNTAMLNGYRVIVIHPASTMNINAANALLKILEEPTPNTLFILICEQSARLPATISSRCQKVLFAKPEQNMALTWLKAESHENCPETLLLSLNLANGAPLKARDFLMNDLIALRRDLYDGLIQLNSKQIDPLQFASKWEDNQVKLILSLLLGWLRDLLCLKLTGSHDKLINQDYYAAINQLIQKLTTENLLQYCDTIQKIYAQILHSLNMNRQLLLKEIFIRWIKLC